MKYCCLSPEDCRETSFGVFINLKLLGSRSSPAPPSLPPVMVTYWPHLTCRPATSWSVQLGLDEIFCCLLLDGSQAVLGQHTHCVLFIQSEMTEPLHGPAANTQQPLIRGQLILEDSVLHTCVSASAVSWSGVCLQPCLFLPPAVSPPFSKINRLNSSRS